MTILKYELYVHTGSYYTLNYSYSYTVQNCLSSIALSRISACEIHIEYSVGGKDFLNKFSTLTPVDVLWDEFLSSCNICMNSIPTKLTSSKCKHPWINNYIKRITRRKQRAYNQALRSNLATDWSKYYDLKRECQCECCTALNRYVSNLVDPNKNIITKPLWSFVKNKR